jgi:hypothetical protein
MSNDKSEFESLNDFFKECAVPIKEGIVFYTYLFIFIIGIGAFGLWGTLYVESTSGTFNHNNVILSIISYALPIFMLLGNGASHISDDLYTAKFFRYLMVIPFLLFFLTWLCSNPIYQYIFAILSVLLTLFFWWIVNANNPNLRKKAFLKSQKNKEMELNEAINS